MNFEFDSKQNSEDSVQAYNSVSFFLAFISATLSQLGLLNQKQVVKWSIARRNVIPIVMELHVLSKLTKIIAFGL